MKEQLINAWQIHNSKNLMLIDDIDDEGMMKTLSARGRNIYLQLVHIHNVRLAWMEVTAKDIYKKCQKLNTETSYNRDILRKSVEDSARAVEELIELGWANEGKLKGFKNGLIPFISYLISHESHHRGQIVLTLKQTGIKLTKAMQWGLWEWG